MPAPEGNQNATDNHTSRNSLFKPEYVKQAEKLCDLGATDEEMAGFFEVDVRTIYRWKLDHVEFCQAQRVGKEAADNRVERSLYQKATGYNYTEEQAFKLKAGHDKEEVEVVQVEKHAPADTTSAIFWLKNRRRDDWRDKQEVGVTDKDGNDVPITDSDRARALTSIFAKAMKEKTDDA